MGEVSPQGAESARGESLVQDNLKRLARQTRLRELGTTLALQIFRLIRVAQFHALDNMAFIQQLDQTTEAIRAFSEQTAQPLSLLFSRGTVFVAGQLLKASRAEYEIALELGSMLDGLGLSEILISPDVTREDLTELARIFQPGNKPEVEDNIYRPTPLIRLRRVDSSLLREEEELTPEEQILRTYASTIVVMRKVFDNLNAGKYRLPNEAKRLAQKLVSLSEGDAPAFIGVTAVRNLNHDAAGRAVNRAILAVCMGRQVCEDLSALSRIAMAALFLDVSHPLLTGVAGVEGGIVPRLTDDELRRLPPATALVLTALGHLRPASMVRTVIAYESQWMLMRHELGDAYGGARRSTAASRIVATAQRFNELMSPDLAASRQPTPDEAILWMKEEARDATDLAMIQLLVGALGLFPSGTPVQLDTGERGVVVCNSENPVDFVRPSVELVVAADGTDITPPVVVDLRQESERQVVAVVRDPDPRLARAVELVVEGSATVPPPARSSQRPRSSRRSGRSGPPPPPSRRQPTSAPSRPGAPESQPQSDEAPTSRRSVAPSTRASQPPISAAAESRRAAEIRLSEIPSEESPTVAAFSPLDLIRAAQDQARQSRRAAPSAQPTIIAEATPDRPLLSFSPEAEEPSASGELSRNPLSHLLLYIASRELTGSLLLTDPRSGEQHAVYFDQGQPTKACLARGDFPLAAALLHAGVLDEARLYSDPISQPPDDESILEAELLELALAIEMDLVPVRSQQLHERLVRLFELPAATHYAFYAEEDLLEEHWGRVDATAGLVPAIAHALRLFPEVEPMARLLATLKQGELRLREDVDVDEMGFTPAELAVADAIELGDATLSELTRGFPDREMVKRVLYVLLITKSLHTLSGEENE
ncbi:MAG: hypothetical protein R3B13_01075 [Polyangiaceae bacterium]